MEKLNRDTAAGIRPADKLTPRDRPVGVLQFGTGGFLRGFADYFLQKASDAGRFDGTVVVIGSTGSGRARAINDQEGLFTLLVRGREAGKTIDQPELISVIKSAVSSVEQWSQVLAEAGSPSLKLIISNTTEVGIVLDESDRIDADPPRTFPGKLTAVLYERARASGFDPRSGVIILPCELIENNGDKLRSIVLTLAGKWGLDDAFVGWLEQGCTFCNTLVDRIVAGTPRGSAAGEFAERLGYDDALLTIAEPYRLWAIEGSEELAEKLLLTGVDSGIVVTPNVEPFRERKVRILNGTHTAMVPAAILGGLETVYEVTQDVHFRPFLEQLAFNEIVPTLESDSAAARSFAGEVLERFENPFIRHELIDITFQQTQKFRVRVLPTILAHLARFGTLPSSIMTGFAALILYNHPSHRISGSRAPKDDAAEVWDRVWAGRSPSDSASIRAAVKAVAGSEAMWGRSLIEIPGLARTLETAILAIEETGIRGVLASTQRTKKSESA